MRCGSGLEEGSRIEGHRTTARHELSQHDINTAWSALVEIVHQELKQP